MKTIKTIFIIVLISLGSIVGNAQEILKSWDYPVKPGTEEWETFKTTGEAVTACRIPEEVITSLSTADLFETCLNYPLLGDVFLQKYITDGIPKIIGSFNGLASLFERNDCAKTILESYKNEQLPNIKSENPTKYFRMFYMELIISTSGILEQLDVDTRTELMRVALDKIEEKREMDYDIFCQSGSSLILSRALSLTSQDDIMNNSVLKTFNETGTVFDLSLIDQINSLTLEYLANHE